MRVDFAFLCDAATESAGKLFALGIGIDHLQVRELPARHPRLTFVARLSFDASEGGRRRFQIRFVDADGRAVTAAVDGELAVTVPPGVTEAKANLIVDLVNLEFTAQGPHELSLLVGDDEVVTLPLEVVNTPA